VFGRVSIAYESEPPCYPYEEFSVPFEERGDSYLEKKESVIVLGRLHDHVYVEHRKRTLEKWLKYSLRLSVMTLFSSYTPLK
jgi:hypothetical protein